MWQRDREYQKKVWKSWWHVYERLQGTNFTQITSFERLWWEMSRCDVMFLSLCGWHLTDAFDRWQPRSRTRSSLRDLARVCHGVCVFTTPAFNMNNTDRLQHVSSGFHQNLCGSGTSGRAVIQVEMNADRWPENTPNVIPHLFCSTHYKADGSSFH